MAGRDGANRRSRGASRRQKYIQRADQRYPQAYTWLAMSALTLGVGAVLASGAGVAHADSTPASSCSSGHIGGPASSAPSSSSSSSPSSQTQRRAISGGGVTVASAARTGTTGSTGEGARSHRGSSTSTGSGSGSTVSYGIAVAANQGVRLPAAAAVSLAAAVGGTGSTGSGAGPGSTLARSASSAPSQVAAAGRAVSVTPAAASPLVGLLAGALGVFGLNAPTAPANPLRALVWGVLRTIETGLGLTPVAGTPTVGTPDLTTGVVTGTLGFTQPAGQPLTYAVTTNPTQGSVTISSTGTYTYTPTTAARLAAGSTTPVVDTFAVTATDGIAATNEAVTVPVVPRAEVPVAGTAAPAVTTVTGSAGLVINLVWDSSVASAPPSFTTAVVQAARIIGAVVSNQITLNIAVGYGEIGGSPIPSGTAEGGPLGGQLENYNTVTQQLAVTCGTTATGQVVIAHLPANNPFGNAQLAVWNPQLKVFGVLPATYTALDGQVGFATDFPSSLLVAAALHELTHAMGRSSGWGSVCLLDLTRYSAPGVAVSDGSLATTGGLQYFSVDGGTTALAYYDNTGDYADFADNNLTANDPFTTYVPSNANSLTNLDTEVLDAIGYTSI